MKSATMHFSRLIVGGDIAHSFEVLFISKAVCCSLTYKVLYAPYMPAYMQLKVVILKNNHINF